MKKEFTRLIKFAERSKGLDTKDKVKLVLFLKKVKPNAEIILKINNQNLEEKYEFEQLLKKNRLIFGVSSPKSYEEIKKIKYNKVFWELEGTYYIYDLFKSYKERKEFGNYIELLKKGKRKEADLIAGRQYGYPKCCINRFIKEKSETFLKKKYTYWQYYHKQQELDRKVPFLFHRPCKLDCKESLKKNQEYEQVLKKISKKIYKEYKRKSKSKGNLIIGDISDVEVKGKSIWPKKNGYEYELIFKKPFRRHYFLVSFLSKKRYKRGQVLKGEVIFQHDYAKVRILKTKNKVIKNLQHERKLPLLGEVTIR